jgi:CubicO group peptidase (beta-lactamase class C family)
VQNLSSGKYRNISQPPTQGLAWDWNKVSSKGDYVRFGQKHANGKVQIHSGQNHQLTRIASIGGPAVPAKDREEKPQNILNRVIWEWQMS